MPSYYFYYAMTPTQLSNKASCETLFLHLFRIFLDTLASLPTLLWLNQQNHKLQIVTGLWKFHQNETNIQPKLENWMCPCGTHTTSFQRTKERSEIFSGLFDHTQGSARGTFHGNFGYLTRPVVLRCLLVAVIITNNITLPFARVPRRLEEDCPQTNKLHCSLTKLRSGHITTFSSQSESLMKTYNSDGLPL